jgi:hypothetical protein
MFPNELLEVSGGTPDDMNCAIVTQDDRLQILKEKPNKLFTRYDEKLTDLDAQWRELLADPVASGRFLGGPRGFIQDKQQWALRSIDLTVCLGYACQVRKATPEVVWPIACRVATNLPILVLASNPRECHAFSEFLEENAVRHAVVQTWITTRRQIRKRQPERDGAAIAGRRSQRRVRQAEQEEAAIPETASAESRLQNWYEFQTGNVDVHSMYASGHR